MTMAAGGVCVFDVNGRQVVGTQGAGAGHAVPKSFRIERVETRDALVILHAADGRSLAATPQQHAAWVDLICADLNPNYEAQAEAAFLDRGIIPTKDAVDRSLLATITDPVLGEFTMQTPGAFGDTAEVDLSRLLPGVPPEGMTKYLWFQGMGHRRVVELLPGIHQILADLPQLLDRAGEFLWRWASLQVTGCDDASTGEGDSSGDDDAGPGTLEEFLGGLGFQSLILLHSGDYAIDFFDVDGVLREVLLDEYWPRVYVLADGTPVEVTVEA